MDSQLLHCFTVVADGANPDEGGETKMAAKFKTVQWLSLDEVAEDWAPQLKMQKSVVLRELRLCLYKVERSEMGDKLYMLDNLQNLLANLPPEDELPSKDTLISRPFIEKFCRKQNWLLPDFWFKELPIGPRFPGRPSLNGTLAEELNQIAQRGELKSTVAEQSKVLLDLMDQKHPGQGVITKAKSVENSIRSLYRILWAEATYQDH